MNKRLISLLLAFLSILAFTLLTSSDPSEGNYTYKPVFMKRADMENAVKAEAPRALKNTGKIYLMGQYLLVNEKYKGIHVIDNSNPADPRNIAFLHIDGCLDMAMKENILYADNAVDLVALKMSSDFKSLQVTSRTQKVFPEVADPAGMWSIYSLNELRPKDGILVAWEKY